VIAVAVAFALAFATALLLVGVSRPVFASDVFTRHNYRDAVLPTGVGIIIVLAVATLVATQQVTLDVVGDWLRGSSSAWDELTFHGPTLVGLCAGFGLLGLLDDLAGVGESGGFRGHLRALGSGHLTTGAIKMIGGPVIALALLGGSLITSDRIGLLRDAAVISLLANLANLFDRAPGRAIKFGLVSFAALVVTTQRVRLAAPALALGAAAGLLPGDLAERFMLGDAGSNVIGAAVGYGVVIGVSPGWRWGALVIVLILNLVSELVSFTRIIDAVGPLRWFDRLGSAR